MKSKIFVLIILIMFNFCVIVGQVNREKVKEAESYFEKSKASLKKDEADKAIEYAGKAISLKNNVSKYYLLLGDAYVLKTKKLPGNQKLQYVNKIKESYQAAIKFDGNNIDARSRLAILYIEIPSALGGSLEKAREQAIEIVKSKPFPGHSILSIIYLKMNDMVNGEKSVEAAFKLHLDFKKKNPGQNSGFNPDILNEYGYQCINMNMIDRALKFFKMNVEGFPDYFNVYDSLAEAYMIKGDKILAIKNYEKAIALNPRKNEYEKKIYNQAVETLDYLKKNKK